jgi:transposase
VVDALGLPLDFEVTEGQAHDVTQAPALIERTEADAYLGDKAYDSNDIRARIEAKGATAVIPNKRNRIQPAVFDADLYKARSGIELTFNRLKQWRRFATRFEKTKRNYSALVAIACAMAWLA